MQFVRYSAGGPSDWGLLADGTVYPLVDVPVGTPSLTAFTNESYRRYLGHLTAEDALPGLPAEDVRLHAPVPDLGKIICIGLNYRDHAEEVGEDLPEEPLLFAKAPTAVTDPGAPIRIPPGIEEVDYEVELGVVIGRTAHRVEAANAGEYVAGYTVFNDVSGRDAQFADGQWFRGKGFDTFAPMGPALATGEEFDPNATDVTLRVNGETKQDSNTDQFIFDVPELVEYVSHAMTLEPGDVIPTGTPAGVGISREPPELLSPGDTVEAEVEGIGTLENPVVDGV